MPSDPFLPHQRLPVGARAWPVVPTRRFELNAIGRLIGSILLLSLLIAIACDEDGNPQAPPLGPQIKTVYSLSKNPNPSQNPNLGLQSNDVFDIMIASSGRTWVSNQGGVSRFNGTAGDGAFDRSNGLPNPKSRAMLEYGGIIWVATAGGGVGRYDLANGTWSTLDSDSGLVSDNVSDIAVDARNNRLYFGTDAGVSIYRNDNSIAMRLRWSKFTRTEGLLDNLVSAITINETPRGWEFWYGPKVEYQILPPDRMELHGITTVREGLAQPIRYTTVNSGLLESNVNDIYYDSTATADRYWVAFATKGLAEVDVSGSAWVYYTTEDGLPSDVIYSITKVGDVIWVGTQNGVARQLPDGGFRGYGKSGGLQADRVRKVYSDRADRLWLGFIDGGAALVSPASAE